MGHGTVPQSGKFLRFDGLRPFAFFADKAGLRVDKLSQVEVSSAVVLGATHQVDRIEMAGALQNGLLRRIFAVDLRCLDNLQAAVSVAVGDKERTAAGFALVFHHPTDADGAVHGIKQDAALLFDRPLGKVVG